MRFINRRGFTLIELLIVVAILALVVGLLAGGVRSCSGSQANKAQDEFRQYIATMYPEYTIIGIAGADRDTDGDGYVTLQARLKDRDGKERMIQAMCASGLMNHGCKELPMMPIGN